MFRTVAGRLLRRARQSIRHRIDRLLFRKRLRGRKTVLISEPNAVNRMAYFPYLWATLKSHFERHGSARNAYMWLDPIFERGDPARILAGYNAGRIDVLGLSCYTWNWAFQCRLASLIKARNRHCVVVAGGPEPDVKDPEFFKKHPYIDAVVVKDGEIPFTRILDALAAGHRLADVKGIVVPHPTTAEPLITGPPEVPTTFDYSPYLDQAKFFERMAAARGPAAFSAVWETNRGCPYSCSFCDWGSATMSKVRRFDMGRVRAEVEFLSRQKIAFLFLVDANFGILPRDVEIAELAGAARTRHGFPQGFYYSAAKNNPERSLEIAALLRRSGLADSHALSIQHTRTEVLAATDRSNISPEKQRMVAKTLHEQGVAIWVQLIIGIPGDTYELWKGCFADLMEWGLHDHYEVFPYHLLPNAPAADKEFLKRWQVETIDRDVPTLQGRRPKGMDDGLLNSRLIVASKTYSRQDWVRMNVYQAFVRALHNHRLTRLVALYLRHTHGVAYQTFYEDLIENFLRFGPHCRLYDTVAGMYEEVLARADRVHDELEVARLPALGFNLSADRWVFVEVCLDLKELWESLTPHLLDRYPDAAPLADLIEYQQNLLVLPDYDATVGKSFPVEYDWPGYFAKVAGLGGGPAMGEPAAAPGAVVEVTDTRCGGQDRFGMDWHSAVGEERWVSWVERMILRVDNASLTTFRHLALRPGGAAARRLAVTVI